VKTSQTPSASFWARLTADERNELLRVGTRVRFDADAPILRQGDPDRHLVVLLSGSAKATKSSVNGPEKVLSLCPPGTVVGELAAITAAPRSATVTALERVEALIVSPEEFAGVVRRHPDLRNQLDRVLAERLLNADERRTEASMPSALLRLAALLADLAEQFAPAGAVLRISQFELASLAATSRSSTARAVRRLRAIGAIHTGRRRIVVDDVPALRMLVETEE
jgi:CRP/FNR family cyclic AMP-dependent transcriptional regulator